MTSQAKIEANRRNAQRSTGPKSAAGRKRASQNSATKGGISGSGKSLSPEDRRKVRILMKIIARELPPGKPYPKSVLRRAAIELFLMQRCESHLSWLYHDTSEFAQEAWDRLRTGQVQALFAALRRCPESAVAKLEMIPQGCSLLMNRWVWLGKALQVKGCWNEPQRSLALDLLRVPREFRDVGVTEVDAEAGEEKPDPSRLEAVVARELARLRQWAESETLAKFDEEERQRTIDGCKFLNGDDARLLERYRAEHSRRYQAALRELREGQRGRGRPASPQSPSPPPVRENEPAPPRKDEPAQAPAPEATCPTDPAPIDPGWAELFKIDSVREAFGSMIPDLSPLSTPLLPPPPEGMDPKTRHEFRERMRREMEAMERSRGGLDFD